MSNIRVRKNGNEERGASLIEYAILVGLVVIICIAAVRLLGQKVSGNFSEVASQVDGI